MTGAPTIYVVDDDPDVRDSLCALLESADYAVEAYDSATKFLKTCNEDIQGCLIADIRMPDMDGLALQEEIVRRRLPLSVIVVTGHGDVPLAVRAMKAGASDFLEKPFDDERLLASVERALEQAKKSPAPAEAKVAAERLASLTERERQVLDLLVAGKANKVIAYELDISPRTVEIHRARVMEKMQARSLSLLVRAALAAGVVPGEG